MKRNILMLAGASALALTMLAACGGETTAPETPVAETPAEPPPAAEPDYAAVLASDRLPDDAARDAARKPAEVMAFSKIMPGQTVLELEAGGGYYTELFARAVGPNGKVIMQSPKEFESFYKKTLDVRLADNRLPNVTVSNTMFDKLDAADASVDVVTWYQGPHELWCKKECGDLPMGEPSAVFADIARVLKPGGYFVVMDHATVAGAPATTGNDLHRLDAAIVKPLIEAAGFTLEEESPLLANAADDHSKTVFDPAIQGQTDQYLLRYRKT
jgi:predicted methyltransferase